MHLLKQLLVFILITASVPSAAQEPISHNENDQGIAYQEYIKKRQSTAKTAAIGGLLSGALYALDAKRISGTIAGLVGVHALLDFAAASIDYSKSTSSPEGNPDQETLSVEQKIEKIDRTIHDFRITAIVTALLAAGCLYTSSCVQTIWTQGFMDSIAMYFTFGTACLEIVVQTRLKPLKEAIKNGERAHETTCE